MNKKTAIKGLYAIERVLENVESENHPQQFEVHKKVLDYVAEQLEDIPTYKNLEVASAVVLIMSEIEELPIDGYNTERRTGMRMMRNSCIEVLQRYLDDLRAKNEQIDENVEKGT